MNYYKYFIRPILFQFHPDYVHSSIIEIGYILGRSAVTRKLLKSFFAYEHPSLKTKIFNIQFENPVGNAGGFDKNCQLIQTLPSVGFGFVEVGSITDRPYAGNKRPWNKRLKRDESLLVNYGLKNDGVDVLSTKIEREERKTPLIVNIAKTNNPSIKGDASVEDYNNSFIKLQSLADIININISCPNSGDGQLFCESPELLKKLLERVSKNKITKPIVLKLKPDISDEMLDEILAVVKPYAFIKGFIISNLTRNRNLLKFTSPESVEDMPGGVSGKPLRELSTQMIRKVYKKTEGKYVIIGLGGIFTAEDAYEKICAGASLVELVTGLIYEGPGVVKSINKGLVELLKKDGFKHISEAVGSKIED